MDDSQIICPSCNKSIPLTQALGHRVREIQVKAEKALEEERAKMIEHYKKRLLEERESVKGELAIELRKKVEQEMALKIADTKNEAQELKEQNKNLSEQILEMSKLMRQLRQDKELSQMEMEKKLAQQEDKIRQEEKKRMDEQYHMKMLEKEKMLNDALKVNDELKRKLEQGSQQNQGEVLELELEKILQAEFPYDEIKPVGKGIVGADIVQIVHDGQGHTCGKIIWETKRTKAWSNEWISKLKDDQRRMKAEVAVIVSEVIPADIKHSRLKDGVWITSFQYFTALAFALRQNLVGITVIKASQVGKNEKMEVLYNYLYGTEFQHRVEAILEAFTGLQDDLEREKRWFTQKWAKQEKSIRKVIDNTVGLRGDLQSITGQSLPEVEGMELLEDGQDDIQIKTTPHMIDDKDTLF
jgi:hypothetical protein